MCGITGWVDWEINLTNQMEVIQRMTDVLKHRGPDANGAWGSAHCALGHRRLSIIDPSNGLQPMTHPLKDADEGDCVLVYNGELYNAQELRHELEQAGHHFRTNCDTEVLLLAYIEWGPACVEKLNGIFAFAIWNTAEEHLFMARDRLGVKPLFYSLQPHGLLFGSELKAILTHPNVEPLLDEEGLAELFVIGPARTPGLGVWKNIVELKPGHSLIFDKQGLRKYPYWRLKSKPHEDNIEQTTEKIKELLTDTVRRQLISDVPLGLFLSGGLDSSALTSLAARENDPDLKNPLLTFSIDYMANNKYFKAHTFQPNQDEPWIKQMSEFVSSNHHVMQFDTLELVEALETAVIAKDLPGMADVDASLFLLCREIKRYVTVALSGEAADEIFGGYPWFHRERSLLANTFPWSLSFDLREQILSPELKARLKPKQYLSDRYEQAVNEVPFLPGENEAAKRMRTMSYLNITRFMPTLLDRKDRMSMAAGLEVRVPYCDHRLVEYVWNIPWDLKTAGMREKGILRKALVGILPQDILSRKKSPFPKTHNPAYLNAVREKLQTRLNDPLCPLLPLINVKKIKELLLSKETNPQLPWFGQLMTEPQLFAYLLQMDFWLRHYNVKIAL